MQEIDEDLTGAAFAEGEWARSLDAGRQLQVFEHVGPKVRLRPAVVVRVWDLGDFGHLWPPLFLLPLAEKRGQSDDEIAPQSRSGSFRSSSAVFWAASSREGAAYFSATGLVRSHLPSVPK